MKRIVLLVSLIGVGSAQAVDFTGAGSSAAAPLYTKWQDAYAKRTSVNSTYDSVGSSAGIKKIQAGAVAFGASDAPMSSSDLKKNNLLDFPTVISGVVPFVNLPGIKDGELRLTPEELIGIYSGRITKWSDPAIVRHNPKLMRSTLNIIPIARADGSGTTFTLTDYFSRVNTDWKQNFGTKFTIEWVPGITTVKGSAGIVTMLMKTPGAIGYAEYAYVLENKLNYIQLKNRDGQFVKPNADSFRAALARSSWQKTGNFEEMLTDKPGAESWPITGSTYIFVPNVTGDPELTAAALKFFTWAFMEGDAIASSLDYLRLPDTVQAKVFREISSVTDTKGNRISIPISLK